LNPTHPPGADAPAPRNILLIRLRRIGDIVMTTPALGLLRAACPGATLSYVVEEPFRRLVEGHPDLDRAIVVPSSPGIAAFARFLGRLRREKFDAVLDFHGGPRAAWMTFASRAPLRIGYETGAKARVYSQRVPRAPAGGAVHSVVNHVNLVRALTGGDPEIPPLRLPDPRPAEEERVGRLLAEAGLAGARFAAVHISAGNAFRDWEADRYLRLVERLGRESGVASLLVGSAADRAKEAEIQARASSPIPSLAGRTNLAELKALIARAALFIGPDSGPMHIAAATRTPIVAVFGPTLPAHFAPWRAAARIVERPLDCRPCRQRRCQRRDFGCIKGITADEVYDACRSILQPA
jgi:lipopolysaccharide heptosyltransferase II